MILAEKIMNLRKKNGWSQEELANQLGVSRQSISKYESSQAIPDMSKILKLSEIFNVSTDYLLKDEIEECEYTNQESTVDEENLVYKVSIETANDFLKMKIKSAKQIALATVLCILSPICLLVLAGLSEEPNSPISENMVAGFGLCTLILLVAIAVGIFMINGSKGKEFEFISTEKIETEYGVSGMVKENKKKFNSAYVRGNIIGTILCICSVIPLFCALAFTEKDIIMIYMVCLILIFVALGVYNFINVGIPMSAMNMLLEEGDYSRKNKSYNKSLDIFHSCYWLIIVAIFFIYSIKIDSWKNSWIIWVIAGILFPVYNAIVKKLIVPKNNKKLL